MNRVGKSLPAIRWYKQQVSGGRQIRFYKLSVTLILVISLTGFSQLS